MPGEVADAIADAYGPEGPNASASDVGAGRTDSIHDAIAQAASFDGEPKPPAGEASAPSAAARFKQGVIDVPTGLGQIAEHVAETPLNYLRKGIRTALNVGGFNGAADLFDDVSTKQFDNIVAQREQDYQKARADALQNGIDWWRIGGQAAATAPAALVGGPALSAGGRIAQGAALGGAQGAVQPSATPGDFWWDKAKGTATGAAIGTGASGLVEAVSPALRIATNAARQSFGSKSPNAVAAASNADTVINETLKAHGVDPNTVDLNVLKGMRSEVADALRQGVAPSSASIASRAEAESLPDPIQLTRGQATGDAMQFAKERNLRGITGVGEPITQRLTDQNTKLISNLDLMGAKDAPDIVSAGSSLGERIRAVENHFTNDQKTGVIDKAYSEVRGSQGQPVELDGKTFADSLKKELDVDYRFLPKEVRSMVEDVGEGRLRLDMKTAQALDKAWSGLQSGAPLNNTADRAIGIAKSKLLDAPLIPGTLPRDSLLAQQSVAAYKAAKALAKQRFEMIASNPAYKAVITGARSGEPDQLFNRYVMNGTAREVGSLARISDIADRVGQDNVGATMAKMPPGDGSKLIGNALMGELKRQIVSGVGERATFNGNALNKFVANPVWAARLNAALPSETVTGLGRLNRVAANVQRAPYAAAVNTSNTGSALVNAAASALKSGAMEKLAKVASMIPGLSTAAKTGAEALKQSRLEQGVSEGLNPGVTLRSLLGMSPEQRAARAAAGRSLTTTATAENQDQSN